MRRALSWPSPLFRQAAAPLPEPRQRKLGALIDDVRFVREGVQSPVAGGGGGGSRGVNMGAAQPKSMSFTTSTEYVLKDISYAEDGVT